MVIRHQGEGVLLTLGCYFIWDAAFLTWYPRLGSKGRVEMCRDTTLLQLQVKNAIEYSKAAYTMGMKGLYSFLSWK